MGGVCVWQTLKKKKMLGKGLRIIVGVEIPS